VEKQGAYQYILNIQGDEPFIQPEQINELCCIISATNAPVATLVRKIQREDDLWDENTVKVVVNNKGKAMYFSRSPVPFLRSTERGKWLSRMAFYKHVGIYAFNTAAIEQIRALAPTPLEKAENLEQLRWLEHGFEIQTGISEWDSLSVDTPHDLEKAIAFARAGKN
jgi:3-deoxy-manno-octulosonate cytidylyltransferase (CMP-KDO synthetase)